MKRLLKIYKCNLIVQMKTSVLIPLLYVMFFLSFQDSYGQSLWITRNLANTPFEFLIHKDSIPDLHKIVEGKVCIKKDTINLMDRFKDYSNYSTSGIEDLYSGHIETYMYGLSLYKKGLLVSLDFVNNRLFQISLYTDNPYYLSNFKLELKRHFGDKGKDSYRYTTDSTVHKAGMIVSYGKRYSEYRIDGHTRKIIFGYYENLQEGHGRLVLADLSVKRRMPFWCSRSGKRKQGWSRIENYLERN